MSSTLERKARKQEASWSKGDILQLTHPSVAFQVPFIMWHVIEMLQGFLL